MGKHKERLDKLLRDINKAAGEFPGTTPRDDRMSERAQTECNCVQTESD